MRPRSAPRRPLGRSGRRRGDPIPNLFHRAERHRQRSRKRRQLAAQRAARPNDTIERLALQAACARYAEAHGAYETMGLLALELARYAPDLPGLQRQARAEAERLFRPDGEG
jgi:hypothetical protein